VISKLTKPGYEILAENTKHQDKSKLVIYDNLVSKELMETHRRVLKENKELYKRHTTYKNERKNTFNETVIIRTKREHREKDKKD
jgi:hypothetical protein